MNPLVFIENGQAVTDSLTVAEVFQKEHKNVLRDINTQIEYAGEEFAQLNFERGSYVDKNNQSRPKINLTEEAFTLVAMSYNTKEAVQMKVKFIQEFKKMRNYIQNKVVPMSKNKALVTVLRTTADLVEDNQAIKEEQHEIRKLITQVDQKVEEQITLDHGEQRRLQKGIAIRIYDLESEPKQRQRLFRELYREIKDRFAVASYKDIKRKDLLSAIHYIDAWVPRRVS